ncbi:MAG: YncE family protein [Gemmatimonadaceae bacterium]
MTRQSTNKYPSVRAALALGAVAAFAAIASAPAQAQAQQPSAASYHITSKVKLGREGGWDYLIVDTAGHRVFISRGTHTLVVDARTDSVVGDIMDTPGVHGIAFAYDLGRGYTSNGRDSSITVFDLKTLAPVARIHTAGVNPDAIVYDDFSHRVFAFNGRSGDATAIDATTNTVAGTIPLGGKPEFAVVDGKGTLWVNIEDKSEIAQLDTKTLAVKNRWALAPCEEPSGLAMDRASRRLFTVCSNKMMAIVDADAGKVVATVPTGDGTDAAGFDPATKFAFASNGEGTLTVVHEDSPNVAHVVQTVATQRGARTMALDPQTHTIYEVTADFGPLPAPTADRPRPRPPMIADSFTLLVIQP